MKTLLGLIVLLLVSAHADAQSMTLERIKKSGQMNIGYVPDAPPMSFRDETGRVTGYSIDLCKRIANEVGRELQIESLKLKYVPLVAPKERLKAVESGRVDIECGATTVTLSRRERVDFTLMTYITGGSILSLSKAPLANTAAVPGKRIAVIDGTTTERSLRRFLKANDFDAKIELIATHDEGIERLNDGSVDGYASDRTMLIGQALASEDAARYALASDAFSFEPYALMIARGDTDFRLVADRALADMYRSTRIARLHHDWFGQRGERMSAIVKAMYEFQAVEK